MPRVSAIIIVFNGERFIAEAIESVLAQDLRDLELVVVDDGSTDDTREIVEKYVDTDPERVRLLRHPDHGNHGMSATRNLGMAKARGEYVAFLDADDVWLPGKLREQVEILDAEPETAMVFGRSLFWHSWDPGASRQDRFYELGADADVTHPPSKLFPPLVSNLFQSPTTCNALMRRDCALAVGGFDPRFRGMFEDHLFFGKLMLRYPVHVSSRTWALYRQHQRSEVALLKGRLGLHLAHWRLIEAMYADARQCRGASRADYWALAKMATQLLGRIARRGARDALRRLFKAPRSGAHPPK
jgi:glycosyltransferase involved in cell wall biosynthesis